ncbi:hypothetical protein PENSPDRAFT_506695 [Peniophora sp. CONT]|nr:hypothetical protein PENSPDRAFT_506695 [Peniophora sp. CONT]
MHMSAGSLADGDIRWAAVTGLYTGSQERGKRRQPCAYQGDARETVHMLTPSASHTSAQLPTKTCLWRCIAVVRKLVQLLSGRLVSTDRARRRGFFHVLHKRKSAIDDTGVELRAGGEIGQAPALICFARALTRKPQARISEDWMTSHPTSFAPHK